MKLGSWVNLVRLRSVIILAADRIARVRKRRSEAEAEANYQIQIILLSLNSCMAIRQRYSQRG